MRRLRDYRAALGPSVKTIRVDIPEARIPLWHHGPAGGRPPGSSRQHRGWRGVTKSEWEGKAGELQLDHAAADGSISLEEAERTIERQRRIIRCHVRCASPYALPCSHIDSSGVADLDACEPCKLPWCFDVMGGPTCPPQESRTFLNSRQDYLLPCRNPAFVTRRL